MPRQSAIFRLVRRTAPFAAIPLCALLGACAKPGPIFPPLARPVQWPPAPEPARIQYVGELRTDKDLKPGRSFFEGMARTLFGERDARAMLTPYAVCTDNADRVFVADSNAQLVHVFDLKTRRYAQWRPQNPEKRFTQPVALAWDPAGRLLVSDAVAGRIYAFNSAGKTVAEIGAEIVTRPCGIAVHPLTRRIYVADAAAHQVIVLTPTGEEVARIGKRGDAPGEFNFPTNLVLDHQGRIYVSDSLNFRVQQILPDMKTVLVIGSKGDMPGYFSQPKGVAVDGQDHLYAVDANFESVQVFDPRGALMLDFGEEGQGPGQFWLPAGIFIDQNNRIWVADTYNQRIQVFDYVTEKRP